MSHKNSRYSALTPIVPIGITLRFQSCAKIRVLDLGVLAKPRRVVGQGYPSGLEHIAPRGGVERVIGILLDQEDRDPGAVDLADGLVDPLHQDRRDAE